MPFRLACLALLTSLLIGCFGGGSDVPSDTATSTVTPRFDDFSIGRPQNRPGIGDVDRALARYESSRRDLISLFQEQPWFHDGLTADESLFVERSLAFVAGQPGDSFRTIRREAVRDKLYLHETLQLRNRQVELLLIYEPGQDAEREFSLLKAAIAALEAEIGVEWPEKAITVINGQFETNDYNNGGFIRIARCCVTSPFILAHELAHTYWSMGPSWFNEGMADIYSTRTLEILNEDPPEGWRGFNENIEALYASRKRLEGRFPDLRLGERFASDGLYQVADLFLLRIREVLGPPAFRGAVADVYAASDFGRLTLKDKRIEDIFLAHTDEGDRQSVMDLFNRQIWGDNGEEYQRLEEFEGS
ncbi:MAG TPA: hypothetical protein VG845_06935 [Dehalococcoidia bacterium]|jgi:hypothetical protein|nr:hypothetical protein [Dehalococcoidia bacterium]